MCKYKIGRAIKGVSVNRMEWVLDGKNGDEMTYGTKEEAIEWLNKHMGKGYIGTEEYEDNHGIYVIEEGEDDETI